MLELSIVWLIEMNENSKITKGNVFNIQRYSLHDGPGIRTVVFLKGCPLSCLWCANPESQNMKSELLIRKTNCIKCKKCVEVCPENCIKVTLNDVEITKLICSDCNKCAYICASNAISLVGQDMTPDELCIEVLKDKIFYNNSGGGVTFSGGEPFAQSEFLIDTLKRCKENGINTVVETSGYTDINTISRSIKYIDTFYVDLKLMDNEKHKMFTKVSNEKILSNIEFIAKKRKNLLVRIPILPGINDDALNIKRSGEFLAGIGVSNVQLLPYHNYGKSKYDSLGRKYLLDICIPTSEEMERIKLFLDKFNLNVII